eukprot:3935412-Rhodomonas_salina.2
MGQRRKDPRPAPHPAPPWPSEHVCSLCVVTLQAATATAHVSRGPAAVSRQRSAFDCNAVHGCRVEEVENGRLI